MNENSFWGRVKLLLKSYGMTQMQFAEHIGISLNTVKSWIYNDRVPDLSAAYSISFSLGVSLEYLLGGKDTELTEIRKTVIEARKAAARILELTEEIQKQLKVIRPLKAEK